MHIISFWFPLPSFSTEASWILWRRSAPMGNPILRHRFPECYVSFATILTLTSLSKINANCIIYVAICIIILSVQINTIQNPACPVIFRLSEEIIKVTMEPPTRWIYACINHGTLIKYRDNYIGITFFNYPSLGHIDIRHIFIVTIFKVPLLRKKSRITTWDEPFRTI